MPLHPDVDGIIAHVRINLNSLDGITKGLSKEQFNWCPETGRWSVGQCIQHLNMIDGADLNRLARVISAAQTKGAPPFHYGIISRKFVNAMELPIVKKFRAPKDYLPPAEVEIDPTVAEFRRICNELIRVAEAARGLDLRKIKTGLSGIPLVKMPIGARMSLIATHDTRHLWQADQVLKAPGFPM